MRINEHDLDLAPEARRRQADRDQTTAQAAAALHAAPVGLDAAGLRSLQRTAGNAGVAQLLEEANPVADVVGKGGEPLDGQTRGFMESRMGADFGDVRVHTGSTAAKSASAVNAHAYTVGTDIAFQDGAYQPGTDAGRHTLAHELTHVVQQRSGPVEGTPSGAGVSISSPSDRFERAASDNADRVMSSPPVQREAEDGHDDHAGHEHGTVQREGEEEELQTLSADRPLQREGEDEELGGS